MTEQTAFISALILCVMLVNVLLGVRVSKLEQRLFSLSRIDAKLDVLLMHSGLEYDPYKDLPSAVVEAVARGNKIEAIKRYREATAVGLKEAKDFIEEIQRRSGTG
jgi:ribosomal protein L7/L12